MVHIVIAQHNPTVGDIEGNLQLIENAIGQYALDEAALLVFPELMITGYPPEDLLTRPGFISQAMEAVDKLVEKSRSLKCALLVGSVWQEEELIYNAALLIVRGEIKHIHKKNSLPNYGVFDERRYFAQGSAPVVCEHLGERLGILICEDGWFEHNWRLLKAQQVQKVIIINASPFEVGKQQQRLDYFCHMAAEKHMALVYVNLVGAQDDFVFDGASFAVNREGALVRQCVAFESVTIRERSRTEAISDKVAKNTDLQWDGIALYPDDTEAIWKAIGCGLKNYIEKNNIERVTIGLSGGIDSAVVATLAADVLGADKVRGVLMPSEITSKESNKDALDLAENLKIETSKAPISPFMDAIKDSLVLPLNLKYGWRENLAIGGNLQARFRGNILMAFSNTLGGVVLNTSNKSEIAVGYSTMYGDACGAYSPLKDVYKTRVYELAKWRNESSTVIPKSIIDKAPTAELAPKQKDSDQLPEYDVLDPILHGLIERKLSIPEMVERGFNEEKVKSIWHMIRASEYKRRQFPPGPKVGSMLFGRDWRYPITSK